MMISPGMSWNLQRLLDDKTYLAVNIGVVEEVDIEAVRVAVHLLYQVVKLLIEIYVKNYSGRIFYFLPGGTGYL